MPFHLGNDQSVYIELTNPIHGGEGWDFGEFLWSPTRNNIGGDSWGILRKLKPGDIVIHSLKFPGKNHEFVGVSLVKGKCIETCSEPFNPGRWKGYYKYYKVPLQFYSPFQKPLSVKSFLEEFKDQLIFLNISNTFYTKDAKKCCQKYVASVPNVLFNLLIEFFVKNNVTLFEHILLQDEGENVASEKERGAPRVKTTIERTIRDTAIVKELKKEYDNRCQICGRKIILPNGNGYSEGHHLQKLNPQHLGPDIKENIIILCPTHHAEFDFGAIGINSDYRIVHIDPNNEFNGAQLAYSRKDLGEIYLHYHMKKIFSK